VRALRARPGPAYEPRLGEPSRALLARLDEADVEAVQARLSPELQDFWRYTDPVTREHLKLILGVHYGVEGVLAKTGLRADAPPEDVHAMGRGPLAAGGDPWIADLVASTLERVGRPIAAGQRVLDFGCSSGRHLRVLQAWRPDVAWTGLDPNRRAIEWAAAHLPGIEFAVSPQEPPLALEAGSTDAVLAISVWSHFGAGAAERWLAEMHRLLRPGGALVFTFQGPGSIAHYLRTGEIDEDGASAAAEALLASGHHLVQPFGPDGDWGVASPEWGMAYMTLEWLLARATPAWSLALHEPSRIDENQDLVVLTR
jgi:SAM-dependent methyltransferase